MPASTSRSATPLRVHPNPFSALDLHGMPAGSVHADPEHNLGNDVVHIGCQVTRTPANGNEIWRRQEDNRDTRYTYKHVFDLAAVAIEHTDYHVRQIKDGSLLCADVETARTAEVKFIEPAVALEAARVAVIADWVANYGVEPPTETWDTFTIGKPACAAKKTAPMAKSINGDDGGNVVGPPIVIGGEGLKVTAPLAAADAEIITATGSIKVTGVDVANKPDVTPKPTPKPALAAKGDSQ